MESADPWFHCESIPELAASAPTLVELDAGEAKHAAGARRLRAGDRVALFDGAGARATVELVAVARGRLSGHVLERWVEPAPYPRLHLACALPKGDRQATMLSMACQLGMSSFTPLACRHSVARASEASAQRWQRILREACKQSRRAHIPDLRASATPEQVAEHAHGPCFVLDPDAPLLDMSDDADWRRAHEIWLLIGPEAGFDQEELRRLAKFGVRPARLGIGSSARGGILRIETAAVAAIGVFAFATQSCDD